MAFRVTRGIRRCIALAVASVALAACGSSPTTPTAASAIMTAPPAAAAASAGSTVIKINGGTLALETERPGTVTLKGSHGFRFDGRVQSGLEPSAYCGPFNPCQPGASVAFTATWLGSDIPGTARVQGQEYVIQGLDATSMFLSLTGSFVAPAHVTDTTSVTVPFAATGLLARGYPLPPLDLTGRGRVTFTLTWQPAISGWAITFTSFDFGNGGGPD